MIEYIVTFLIFVLLQSWFINGLHNAFKGKIVDGVIEGEILFKLVVYRFYYSTAWWKPAVFTCVKCMASFWGAITFWSAVLIGYGFHWQELPLFLFDVCIISYLNYFFYKIS